MNDDPTRPRAARASTLPLQGRDNPVRFGINFLPHSARELLDWVKAAEDTGFDIAGVADSQSLYRDVYVCEALVATNTLWCGPTRIVPPFNNSRRGCS